MMSLRGPAHFVIVSVSETISVLKMCGINSAEAISFIFVKIRDSIRDVLFVIKERSDNDTIFQENKF